MHVISRCPACRQIVNARQRNCPHCVAKLTRAKFQLSSVLLYGAIAIFIAFIFSFLIVPLTIVAVLTAMFARQNLHVVSFNNDNDNKSNVPPTSTGKGRLYDVSNES